MSRQQERIDHILKFMNYDGLTERQQELVESYEDFYHRNDFLTDRQMEVLEDIFEKAAERE